MSQHSSDANAADDFGSAVREPLPGSEREGPDQHRRSAQGLRPVPTERPQSDARAPEVARPDSGPQTSGPQTAVPSPADGTAGDSATPDGKTPPPREPENLPSSARKRLERLEKQNFRMKLSLVMLVLVVGYLAFGQAVSQGSIVQQTLMESRELKLLDNEGNARLFLRMYSRVPVLQLLDSSGKPRLSLGMRFDDTPFIDLSDRTGRTRATLELTEGDEPALRLFNERGETTFKIN